MSNRDREDLREAGQDAALEHAWREGSAEQPSARVDAAILAAAHAAAADRQRVPAATPARVPPRQRWSRWAPMAAAAAVAGLAFMLVQTLPRDPERAPTPSAQESAKTAAPASAPTPATTPPASAARQGLEPPRARETVSPVAQEQESAADLTLAPQGVPVSPTARVPAAIPAESTLGATAAAPQAPPVGSNESRADSNAARSKAVDAAMTEQATGADAWVEKITALHDAGDIAAAADTLRAFRAAVPDADRHLPESLREWAALVR
jgi:hypothetical protein